MGGFEPTIAANNSGRGTAGPHIARYFKLRAQHLCCRCSGLLWQISRFGAAPRSRAPRTPRNGARHEKRPCRRPRELGGASRDARAAIAASARTRPARPAGRSVRELVATTPRHFVKTTPTASTSASRGAPALIISPQVHIHYYIILGLAATPEALDEQRAPSKLLLRQITARTSTAQGRACARDGVT